MVGSSFATEKVRFSPAHLREAVEAIEAVENSNRLRAGCASEEKAEAGNAPYVV